MIAPLLAPKRYGKRMTDKALRIWKKVRDEGGWWTGSEMALYLGMDAEEVRSAMRNMVDNHYLALRVHPVNGLRRVGVTHFCYPPKGESLEPGRSPESWGA